MEDQTNLDQNDSAAPAPAKSGFRAIWILWGCGGMALLFIVCLATCFGMVKGGMKVGEREFGPACEEYLAKVKINDYQGAYLTFSDEMKGTIKEDDYIALDRGLHERLGALQSKSLQFVTTGVDQKGHWGRLIYQAKFEKADGTIRFELRKVGKEYKLYGFNYNSPILAEAFKSVK